VADFRKQRDKLKQENSAYEPRNLPRSKRLFSKDSYKYNKSIIVPAIVILILAPLVGWFILGQQREDTRAILNSVPQPGFSETLTGPEADQLEQRVSSLNANMQSLSGLLTDVESKLITTDRLEERITGLTQNLEALSNLTADLESRQVDTDQLEARITGLTENVEKLSGITADLESRQANAEELEARISRMSDDMSAMDQQATELEARQQAADQLEARVTRISGSMEQLDKLADNLESRQATADSLEAQVASLSRELAEANNVIADLESRQAATQQLEARVAKITKEVALLIDLSAGLEPDKVTTLASRGSVAGQKADATPSSPPATGTATSKTPTTRTPATSPPTKAAAEQPVVAAAPAAKTDRASNERSVEQLYAQRKEEGPWKINLISSPSREEATHFSNRAKSKGVKTQLQEVSVRGTPYWRVQIIGFANYDEALAHSDSVKATLGLKETWIFKR
jgi:uncharacterized coiled-coil DUF342 family protein